MIDKEKLIDLFTQYEYETLYVKDEEYAVFSSGTSMYPAVEIVKLSEGCDSSIANQKKDYSEAGYAVRICEENTIEDIEHYLFNWFFQVKETNRRISAKYEEYTRSIMQAYVFQGANVESSAYQYINIPFSIEHNFIDRKEYNVGLLDRIRTDLKKDGPQLIIVEAGAGFGKTSTVYEILKDYETVEKNVRPFFMELSKDRIAPTFHYLLNSQIDANFKVRLGSDIVLHNIKRGYIPLIIDGFDELLSRDLDNGEMDAKFSKVETMLSTIADLLYDQAKVILTTRKTAIFAGENFYEWYQQLSRHGHNFEISRYQLGNPSIQDWLPKHKLNALPQNFDKISNPVLLGYLRYLDDNEFNSVVASSTLTKHYLNSILKREIERQDLPFNIQEQIVILRRLAAYFAGLDSTAFCRSEIKETIRETSRELLESHATAKKDVKSLSNTLTNHAFLDRKGDSNIGFLNDFILGTFLMYAIINEEDSFFDDFLRGASFSILEKSILAAAVFDTETKNLFWEQLFKRCSINNILEFWSDTLLRERTIHSFSNISFDGKNLYGVLIGSSESPINKCSFSNMVFTDCVFDFNHIIDCAFINCKFKSCSKEGTNLKCGFYGCCDLDNSSFIDTLDQTSIEVEQNDEKTLIDLLKLYFQVDERTQRMRMISRIKDSFEPMSFKKIFALAESNGFIMTNGDKSFITKKGRTYYNDNKL